MKFARNSERRIDGGKDSREDNGILPTRQSTLIGPPERPSIPLVDQHLAPFPRTEASMSTRVRLLLGLMLLLTFPTPSEATFSIVARDPETGDLGVAVQSHYFSVGPIVPWAEPRVGAVATQSLVEVSYGPKGLQMMSSGRGAKQTLEELLSQDSNKDVRQVAMIDSHGDVAAWTGKRCIPGAGGTVGAPYLVQANLMSNERIWPAMAQAYETTKGDLAARLLASLEAGQKARRR